jgi:hypothetical protein
MCITIVIRPNILLNYLTLLNKMTTTPTPQVLFGNAIKADAAGPGDSSGGCTTGIYTVHPTRVPGWCILTLDDAKAMCAIDTNCTGVALNQAHLVQMLGYNPGALGELLYQTQVIPNPNSTSAWTVMPKLSPEFCMQKGAQATCDTFMFDYCKTHPTDPKCTCINSKVPMPQCNDGSCSNTGYLTSTMANTPCPDVVNCTAVSNYVSSGAISFVTPQQSQQCGSQIAAAKQTANSTSKYSSLSNFAYICGGLLLIVVAYMVFRKRKSR